MSVVVHATYENGVLKPDSPLPLDEKQRVKITVHTGPGRVEQNYGLLKWTGDAKDLDYLLNDPENDPWERS